MGGYNIFPKQVGPETALRIYSLRLTNERLPINFCIGAFAVGMAQPSHNARKEKK
jgi:hypothetical protein